MKCHTVGREVLELLEQGLGLRHSELLDRCCESPIIDELRMNYYAPLFIEKSKTRKYRRAWPHTNFRIIILIFQDDAGGLEVQDCDSDNLDIFIPIVHEHPTKITTYISNSLEYVTNS